MTMFILGLQGSPRKNGNTDVMLRTFMEKAGQAGAATHTIQVAKAGVAACKGCGYCESHGRCVITDDPMATEIFGLIRKADLVVAASPVYFYGISAQLKGLIDRCQTFWSRKYVYKLKDPLATTRQGILFSVAASRGRQLFDGIHLTAKYFFDAIDARFEHALTYRGVESKGAIREHEKVEADIDALIEKTVRPMLSRKQILFVSPQGACRAPLAAALAQAQHGDQVCTGFAGLTPASALSPTMLQAIEARGMDLGYRKPVGMDQTLSGTPPDLIVVMDKSIPDDLVPGVKTQHWPLSAPDADDHAAMERLIGDVETHIETLLAQP
jgi:arsenate reductase (thioredoxin)